MRLNLALLTPLPSAWARLQLSHRTLPPLTKVRPNRAPLRARMKAEPLRKRRPQPMRMLNSPAY